MEIGPELVRRAQRGEAEGLRELVEAAYPSVRRWALVRTGDPMDADDLAQDVMIQMIRKLSTFDHAARFGTWLYTVTRNAAADRLRRSKRRAEMSRDPRAVEALAPQAVRDPGERVQRSEVREVVLAFFRDLPARQREVFDLIELQGMTSADAASLLGIEAVSVRASLFKARRTLRARILSTRPEWSGGEDR